MGEPEESRCRCNVLEMQSPPCPSELLRSNLRTQNFRQNEQIGGRSTGPEQRARWVRRESFCMCFGEGTMEKMSCSRYPGGSREAQI
jgi:hypothetical protein